MLTPKMPLVWSYHTRCYTNKWLVITTDSNFHLLKTCINSFCKAVLRWKEGRKSLLSRLWNEQMHILGLRGQGCSRGCRSQTSSLTHFVAWTLIHYFYPLIASDQEHFSFISKPTWRLHLKSNDVMIPWSSTALHTCFREKPNSLHSCVTCAACMYVQNTDAMRIFFSKPSSIRYLDFSVRAEVKQTYHFHALISHCHLFKLLLVVHYKEQIPPHTAHGDSLTHSFTPKENGFVTTKCMLAFKWSIVPYVIRKSTPRQNCLPARAFQRWCVLASRISSMYLANFWRWRRKESFASGVKFFSAFAMVAQ